MNFAEFDRALTCFFAEFDSVLLNLTVSDCTGPVSDCTGCV